MTDTIDTSAILDGSFVLQSDKTVGHFHTDPKLFHQVNVQETLKIGQFVYLDTDGLYKPAIATTQRSSNVQGIVYSFVGNDEVYIKHTPGHMFYRHPLPPEWFAEIDGVVQENAPLFSHIPNLLGHPVYLSDVHAGGMMTNPPSNNKYVVLVGYRTDYGFYFKPEPYCCESMQAYSP